VEDDESMFRFNYSFAFLRWALTPPGYVKDWHIAVRRKKDQKVLAFISGIPITMRLEKTNPNTSQEEFIEQRICEINFLCIHKMLREKRLAPILIKEVTRRVNLLDMWQAIYTAGVVLPTPFASAQYFHRSLNPEKLVAIRFSRIPPQFQKFQNPLQMMKRNYAVPEQHKVPHFRAMVESDIPAVTAMLSHTLETFLVAPRFNEEEVRHWLLPRESVVFSYVVEDPKTHTAVDFVSFYSLPSTVIGNSKFQDLRAAYTFYYSANTLPLKALILEALVAAKHHDFDVMNTLDIMQNQEFITDLKFGPGDGNLHYYFYNWAMRQCNPTEVGLVML
jgi:glycylpeptide N-tetradecanoyltransferase